jgi:hypothetical protein
LLAETPGAKLAIQFNRLSSLAKKMTEEREQKREKMKAKRAGKEGGGEGKAEKRRKREPAPRHTAAEEEEDVLEEVSE